MSRGIGEICQGKPDVIRADDSVAHAAERMRQRTVGCLIVVNTRHQPIGMVTDRDLVIRVVADAKDADLTPVIDVMSADPVVATAETTVGAALALMRDGPFRRLPIVDAQGVLVGLLTLDDILMKFGSEFGEIKSVLKLESPAGVASAGPIAGH
jgi:CBS domain-containing protein